MARPSKEDRRADLAAPVVFAAFLVAGGLFILLAKLLFELSPFIVTSVPCLLMVGYSLLVASSRRLRLREDQSADNFYYMGFIFTLISLAISLYQYGSEGSLETIVRNFGVAIASTITGITLRIVFNQMRRDPVEVEHYSRLELAEASSRVRRELDGVEKEFQHFRRSNQQMLAESFAEIRDEVAKSAAESLKASEKLAEQMLGATNAANEAVTSQLKSTDIKAELDQTTKNLKRIATALAKASDQIEKSAGSFVNQISRAAPTDDRLHPLIQHLDETIQKLAIRLEAQTNIIEEAQTNIRQTADIERNIARIIADEDLNQPTKHPAVLDPFAWRVEPEIMVDEKPAASDR
jgi:hypothetical protein